MATLPVASGCCLIDLCATLLWVLLPVYLLGWHGGSTDIPCLSLPISVPGNQDVLREHHFRPGFQHIRVSEPRDLRKWGSGVWPALSSPPWGWLTQSPGMWAYLSDPVGTLGAHPSSPVTQLLIRMRNSVSFGLVQSCWRTPRRLPAEDIVCVCVCAGMEMIRNIVTDGKQWFPVCLGSKVGFFWPAVLL